MYLRVKLLEFGVAAGTSLNLIAKNTTSKIYGFDSFEGLPEDWLPGAPKGKFRQQSLPVVPDNVELVVGLFGDTLPTFLDQHPEPIAFLHVDCDIYSSTRTIFDLCGARIVKGTVIVFDEYFNYPGWRRHEYRAFAEFSARTGRTFEYLGYTGNNEQVAVRLH